jgi:hypothetical protein
MPNFRVVTSTASAMRRLQLVLKYSF